MAEELARYNPGQNVPVFASVELAAGRCVEVTGAKTNQGDYSAAYAAAATGPIFGVTQGSSGPTTQSEFSAERRVSVARRGAIARVEAGATVVAGAEVEVGTNGMVITLDAGTAVGRALTGGDANEIIEVDLY